LLLLQSYTSKGNARNLFPVNLKSALLTAGANGGTAGSPTPSGDCVLGTIQVSTTGDWAMCTKG
jgi:hypothetical protein